MSGLDYQPPSQPHGKLTQQRRLWRNTGTFPKQTNPFHRNDKLLPMENNHLKRWHSNGKPHSYLEPFQKQYSYGEMQKTFSTLEQRNKVLQKRHRKIILLETLNSKKQEFIREPLLIPGPPGIGPICYQSSVDKVFSQVIKSNGNKTAIQDVGNMSGIPSILNYTADTKDMRSLQTRCKSGVQTPAAKKRGLPQFKIPPNRNKIFVQKVRGNENKRHGKVPLFNTAGMKYLDFSLANNGKSDQLITSRVSRRITEPEICDGVETSHPDLEMEDHFRLLEDPPPWFDSSDIEKMKLLASGSVVAKARIPAHGQVIKVGLSFNSSIMIHDLMGHCQEGLCGLIKRPSDLDEVLAFHLDRVLGLNRSLPVVARRFNDALLPYKFTDGAARPIVWWDADIQHLNDPSNDQNSFELSWFQYQAVLRQQCGTNKAPENQTVSCLSVKRSEWGKLALFDFLLQVHDRLDRHCCGFNPDFSEPCVEDLLHEKCRNLKDHLLVHILVRKGNPSQLVYIDNAGRLLQHEDNLNFRLLEGIDEFPADAISLLQSGCLRSRLLRSLRMDTEFWESHNGIRGLKKLVQVIEKRAQLLLNYILENNIKLVQG
ncbi:Golgi-associated kinase 1A [Mustelus asterias]